MRFTDTILYGAETEFQGRRVHVLGYQNRAQNHAGWRRMIAWAPFFGSANAMILPFPAVPRTMTSANVIETEQSKHILQDMAQAVSQPIITWGRSLSVIPAATSPRIQVFDAAGIYTIVLAQDARDIPSALQAVPEDRRPRLNAKLFETYARWYPEWTIALCCFNNKQLQLAEPMIWWYEPAYPDRLHLPAVDCHTGNVPNLSKHVKVDHVVALASDRMPAERGMRVQYRDLIPDSVSPFIHAKVIGRRYTGRLPNGDFTCNIEDVREGQVQIVRSHPPGARPKHRQRGSDRAVQQ